MIYRLAELQALCRDLDLTVYLGPRKAKGDYLEALRVHYLKRDYPQGQPFTELSPMLSFPYWNLHADERERLWEDHNAWLVQQKFDGCRAIVHFVRGVGTFVHGRNIDTSTYRRTDLTFHTLFADLVPNFSAIVDTEVVMEFQIDTAPFTSKGSRIKPSLQAVSAVLALRPPSARMLQAQQLAPLRFKVFDIVQWDGQDLRRKVLCERLPYLQDFLTEVKPTSAGQYFEIAPHQLYAKKLFFDRVLASGGEGVIFKNLNHVYQDSSKRSRRGWIKHKRSVELDAFVSGHELGKPTGRWKNRIATLLFSVDTENGLHLIAKISSLPKRERAAITVKDPVSKVVSLHPGVIGRVAHLVGAEITSKSLRLLHPRVVRWSRLGVVSKDCCVYSMEGIKTGQLALPLIKPAQAPDQTQ